jgi:hypothetical protein
MKRDAGLAAGLAAVLALLGITTLRAPRSGGSSNARFGGTAAPGGVGAGQAALPCSGILSHVERLLRDANPDRLPDSCYAPGATPSSPPHSKLSEPDRAHAFPDVSVYIAMVPDPVSTHLALTFDRIVESIQQAAQDNYYSYDGSWFPWTAASLNYSRAANRAQGGDEPTVQASQPGVIVCRRSLGVNPDDPQNQESYQNGLVILLVGEEPTGGISGSQFDNALQWLRWLRGSDSARPVGILGPVFSGSLPSLRRELVRNLGTRAGSNATVNAAKVEVSSGTVSSGPSYEWFKKWLSDSQYGSFRTAFENDDLMSYRFCRYLRAEGYSLNGVAELSEDETAFGNLAGETTSGEGQLVPPKASSSRTVRDKCPAVSLYYPRDIANLRSAYEEQSIFSSAGNPSSDTSQPTPSSELRANLREPANAEHDTVHHYAGALTPIAQESLLVDITNRLREGRAQFIILRGTSSLDQIFLAEFLRRSYPAGRLVIDGADLLFTRRSWGESLRGVMVLSTYPLLTMEAEWSSPLLAPSGGVDRTFDADTSAGVYIAAREMFRDSEPDRLRPDLPIFGYTPPPWDLEPGSNRPENEVPPTWLTVIAHRQFWPVAALNPSTIQDAQNRWAPLRRLRWLLPLLRDGSSSPPKPPPQILLTSTQRGDGGPQVPSDGRPKVRLPAAMIVLLMICIVWAGAHLYLCWEACPSGSPRARAYFAPTPHSQHAALIAFGGLSLAMVAVVVGPGSGCFAWIQGRLLYQQPQTGPLLLVWLVLVVTAAVLSMKKNYAQPVLCAESRAADSIHRWRFWSAVAAAVVGALFLLIHLLLGYGLSSANAVPTLWRDINLVSGVSPLLPQLLLLAGMYLWFWFNLHGLAHFGDDRPLLPVQTDLTFVRDESGTEDGPRPPRPGEVPVPEDEKGELGKPTMPMFSRESAGEPVERASLPWGFDAFESLRKPPLQLNYVGMLLVLTVVVIVGCRLLMGAFSVRTLGEHAFGVFIFFWICLCMAAVLADAAQLWLTWSDLRQLLVHLDRLPLRRTLRDLKGLAWGSIWKMSGNVLDERYRVLSLEIESLRHLQNSLLQRLGAVSKLDPQRAPAEKVLREIKDCLEMDKEGSVRKVADWYNKVREEKFVRDVAPMQEFQKEIAKIAGQVMTKILMPAWRLESESLIFESRSSTSGDAGTNNEGLPAGNVPRYVRAAEELFVLPYLAFIQNVLGRMRTIALASLWLFVATTLAASSYPFEPLDRVGGIFLTVFLLIAVITILVYSQMSRDATLSHITNTQPGRLGWDFGFKIAAFGIGPLIGLLTTLFPSITDFLFSWLQPGAGALR